MLLTAWENIAGALRTVDLHSESDFQKNTGSGTWCWHRIFSLQNGHPGFSFVLQLQTDRSSRSEGVGGQVRMQNSLEMLYKQLSNSLGSIRKRLVRIYSVYIRRTCFSIATRRFKTILFIYAGIFNKIFQNSEKNIYAGPFYY